jgi:hypothetical protein
MAVPFRGWDLYEFLPAGGAGAMSPEVGGRLVRPAAEIEADDAAGLVVRDRAIAKGAKLW